MKYVIAGPVDSEDGTLYWSNDDGWGFLSTATVFTAQEHDELQLPLDGRWEALPMQIVALVDAQGTACAETALYGDEDTPERRAEVEREIRSQRGPDRPIPGSWTNVSANDALQEFGRDR